MKHFITFMIIGGFTMTVWGQQVTFPGAYLYNFHNSRSGAVGYIAAVGDDGYWAFFQNPALGGLMQQRAFSVVFADLGLQQRLLMGGLYYPHIGEGPLSLAAGWGVLQVGDIDGRDALGNPTERFGVYHHVGAVNLAYGGFQPEDEWYSSLAVGLSLKWLWNDFYYIRGSGWLTDIGVLWGLVRDDFEVFPYSLQIGFMVSELGGEIRWNTGRREKLQPRMRMALLWAPKEWVRLMTEATRLPSREIGLGAGMELVLLNHINLRAGWHSVYGLTFGLALHWGEEKQMQLSAAQLVSPFQEGTPRIWEVGLEY